LRIVDLGRFALSFYEKYTGDGVRVFVDNGKLADWPECRTFFFKLVPKREQDFDALVAEARQAGDAIFGMAPVKVDLAAFKSARRGAFAVCPRCGEGYPLADGEICLGCRGEAPYLSGA
jgi:formylmethanofuran dehydrogenase subunit E